MTIAYVGLGSNLGDRRRMIREALRRLDRVPGVRVRRRSRVRETDPVGPPQPRYLNAVAEVETRLGPAAFLRRLQGIEDDLGRRRAVRWGPRTIDLDLLLWGDRRVRGEGLRVPHPRLPERTFVLEPLAELCPGQAVPGTGARVRELLRAAERNRS